MYDCIKYNNLGEKQTSMRFKERYYFNVEIIIHRKTTRNICFYYDGESIEIDYMNLLKGIWFEQRGSTVELKYENKRVRK